VWDRWLRDEFNRNRVSLGDAEYAELVERIRSKIGV